jgi:sec-independent protein translocase protein TatB
MFDIGFSELVVIGVVLLVVVGPERLPRVARTAGILLGRLQRYVNGVKADIRREMQFEELQRQTRALDEALRSEANDIRSSVQSALVFDERTLPEATAAAEQSRPPAPAETVSRSETGQNAPPLDGA